MVFWDWKSGHLFQSLDTTAQPGSLDAEAGIMYSLFDRTGSRLITAEADKTSTIPYPALLLSILTLGIVKVWKEDERATPESHPLQWNPTLLRRNF